jgi:amino acid adenylation domain-containing protein
MIVPSSPALPATAFDEFPTSFAQELLWLLESASPGLTAYNVTRALRLTGPLDADALERALARLVERHEILRTVYTTRECGATRQRVLASARIALVRHDLSELGERERTHRLREIVADRARLPFDLGSEIPLRAALVRLGADEHALTIESHHIASDGWSGGILGRELSAFYRAERRDEPAALPALPIQYADFAAWQREEIAGERLDGLVAFWRARLADANTSLNLPTDRPRPLVAAYDGAIRGVTLPVSLLDGVKRLAARNDATLYMTVLAAFQVLLHRYTGQDDVLVGSPIAGRDAPDTEGLIGYFASTLVHRSRSNDDPTFLDHLARVREGCLGAFQHQDLPFEKMMLELRDGRPQAHASLFQVVFTMLDNAPARFDLDGVAGVPLDVEHGTTKFELTLFASERPTGLRLACQYRTDLFDAETIDRMLGHLGTLLDEAVRDPGRRLSRLPLMSQAERAQVLVEWNESSVSEVPDVTIDALFEAQARRVPERIAVISGAESLTYADVNAAANRLAHALRARGIGEGSPVGVCLERSPRLIVAMLGILKAGGCYVPLVPELPAARLAQQLHESGATVVVTAHQWLDRVPAPVAYCVDDAPGIDSEPVGNPAWPVKADQPAYVLFTSGSTGTPKGVAVTHRNIVNYTTAIGRLLGFDLVADPRALHFATVTTIASDLGNTAIYPALLSGGCLHLIPEEVATDASAYADYIAARAVDVLKITPSHLRALMAGAGGAVLPNRYLVLGGEACPWDLVELVARVGRCRIVNHYGPTETTVGCCAFMIGDRNVRQWAPATVPIGRPLANVRAYVLDAHRQPVPVGIHGELYVGGPGVAQGYLGRPDLTAERFVADPFAGTPGARMYRTGDRVRQLPTGDIEFLGRADDQVKIRGYRVEPAEIEAVIRSVPGVTQAAVVARGDRLVAYVCGSTPSGSIRDTLATRLPEYMVPHAVVSLDRLPLTPNGKLDRAALPDPGAAATDAPSHVEPRTPTEVAIAQIWGEVLKRERVGAEDNFLELGGHSLMAIRILGRLSKTFGVRLPLRVLFEAPTVGALALQIDELARAPVAPTPKPAATLGAVDRSAYRRPAGGSAASGAEPPR